MFKNTLKIIGTGLAMLSLAACSSSVASTNSQPRVEQVPQPVSEAIVLDKSIHTTTEKKPIYGAPTIAPGIYQTTTDSKTEYTLIVSYGENGSNTSSWKVKEFAFNTCEIGEKAIRYNNGNVACVSASSEEESSEESTDDEIATEETGETTSENAESEEASENELTEPFPTVPNGFAKPETTEEG